MNGRSFLYQDFGKLLQNFVILLHNEFFSLLHFKYMIGLPMCNIKLEVGSCNFIIPRYVRNTMRA